MVKLMIYSNSELKKQGYDSRTIKNKVIKGELYKLESGLYSTKRYENEETIISKKYPKSVITLLTAFYQYGYTDFISDSIYVSIPKNYSKIAKDNVEVFVNDKKYYELGIEYYIEGNVKIKIYNLEKLLIELIKYRNKIPYEQYKEIINNYRKNINNIDFSKLLEYLKILGKKYEYVKEIIHKEVM